VVLVNLGEAGTKVEDSGKPGDDAAGEFEGVGSGHIDVFGAWV